MPLSQRRFWRVRRQVPTARHGVGTEIACEHAACPAWAARHRRATHQRLLVRLGASAEQARQEAEDQDCSCEVELRPSNATSRDSGRTAETRNDTDLTHHLIPALPQTSVPETRKAPRTREAFARKSLAKLPRLESNQESSDPESDVLPVTPRGSALGAQKLGPRRHRGNQPDQAATQRPAPGGQAQHLAAAGTSHHRRYWNWRLRSKSAGLVAAAIATLSEISFRRWRSIKCWSKPCMP